MLVCEANILISDSFDGVFLARDGIAFPPRRGASRPSLENVKHNIMMNGKLESEEDIHYAVSVATTPRTLKLIRRDLRYPKALSKPEPSHKTSHNDNKSNCTP
jgi:hypothetical protein